MYSDFYHFVLLGMSNSELFLVKEDYEGGEFDILKRPPTPSTEHHDDESHVTAASNDDRELRREPDDDQVKEDKYKNVVGLGELKATDHDDDEGFRTPTSTDHKIVQIKQCPLAPKKSKSTTTKRESSSVSSSIRRNLQLDLSEEVDSLFPKPILDDLHRKIKKPRAEDQENE